MTSKVVYYYSLTGKTEAIIEQLQDLKIYKLNNIRPDEFSFGEFKNIYIGTPTYGRGVPPYYFKEILDKLVALKDRNIGLFGSGNTIYGHNFCGALDVLEQLLSSRNRIIFKYKFEGYPRQEDVINLTQLIMGVNMRIVKYETDNCSYCVQVGKYLSDKEIPYEAINVMDCDPGLCVQHNIMSVPVVILFDENGNEVTRSTGYKTDELKSIIKLYRGEI